MDPISAALLLAVASGAGGAVGDQAWRGLVALVHRPERSTSVEPATAQPSGSPQLATLHHRPDDPAAAAELAEVLTARADADGQFEAALEAWRYQAERVYPAHRSGTVHNSVSGGTFHGTVVQAGGAVYLSGSGGPSLPQPPRTQSRRPVP